MLCGGNQTDRQPANQPGSQRCLLHLQIYDGILLQPDFCRIRRSHSLACRGIRRGRRNRKKSRSVFHARPESGTLRLRIACVREPNSATPDVPQTATRSLTAASATVTKAETPTPVTLRSRHLILSRPFEFPSSFVSPSFRTCFRLRLFHPSS